MDPKELKAEYESVHEGAEQFREMLREDLKSLLEAASVPLGTPMESRVKEWSRIEEKIGRRELDLDTITELGDLIGLRIILLYLRDVKRVCKLIEDNFADVRKEDASRRLGVTQFGYQSIHYDVKMKAGWLARPTARGLGHFRAEIQVRTVAQHIWAASSHQLQYKKEDDVPRAIRRSIHRVSALLEIVDLEFERVLQDREEYLAQVNSKQPDEPLNVDVLRAILDAALPEKNKNPKGEPYALLLDHLRQDGIDTSEKLQELLVERLSAVLAEDQRMLKKVRKSKTLAAEYAAELRKGAYFFQAEIVLRMLSQKKGGAADG